MPVAIEEKTQEQLAKEAKEAKIKAFNEDPDAFIHMDQIIAATFTNAEGKIMFVLGRTSRPNLLMAQAEINFQIMGALAQIEVGRARKRQASQPIIVPTSGKIN